MNNYGCKICLASLYSVQLTPPLIACSSAVPAAALDRTCAVPLELGPSVSVPALRVRAASLPRVPVHQVRLPQEDGPQDGSSQLLRAHPEAQTHPQGVQPPGVLPAHVSIPWTCRGTSPSQHCHLKDGGFSFTFVGIAGAQDCGDLMLCSAHGNVLSVIAGSYDL